MCLKRKHRRTSIDIINSLDVMQWINYSYIFKRRYFTLEEAKTYLATRGVSIELYEVVEYSDFIQFKTRVSRLPDNIRFKTTILSNNVEVLDFSIY